MQPVDYQTLFEFAPEPRMVIRKDTKSGELLCVEINQAALKLFYQQSKPELPADPRFFIPAKRWSELRQLVEKALITNSEVKADLKHMPHFAAISYPCNGEGTMFEMRFVNTNTFERQLENERKDALQLLSSIFEVSEVGFIITNEDGHMTKINDSFFRIFGWEPEDLIGKDFSIIISEEHRARIKKSYERFIKSGVRSTGEVKVLKRDGSVADTVCTTTSVLLENGKRYMLTTIMDVSLRKRMEESLRQARDEAHASNKAKSAFLANMSHELRTPLNAIIGFSEMMAMKALGPLGNEKYEEYNEDIHESACHLLSIINEVLDMSKIESGSVELNEEKINLEDLMNTAIRLINAKQGLNADDTSVISFSTPAKLPLIRADSRMLKQVFLNILSNAVKYATKNNEDPFIHVIATISQDQSIKLVIKDNGPGIPEEMLDHVLKPFGQVNDAFYATENSGTGLGLPIAKGIMEIHGGSLNITSKKGLGTQVMLTIPANRVYVDSARVKLDKPLFSLKPPPKIEDAKPPQEPPPSASITNKDLPSSGSQNSLASL